MEKSFLVIPHTPHMHVKVRSFEIAKALSRYGNPYYLLWDEENDFSLWHRLRHWGRDNNNNDQYYCEGVTVLNNIPKAYAPYCYANMHNGKVIEKITRNRQISAVINSSFILSPVKKKSGRVYVYDFVDDPFGETDSLNRARLKFLTREVAKADIITACSYSLKDHLSRLFHKEISYLPNGVDTKSFQSVKLEDVKNLRNQLNIDDRKVIGFISNFEPWNGLSFLIDVFKRISSKSRDMVLLLVGKGRGLDSIQAKAAGNPNIIMTGAVHPSEVALYFHAIDVGVLPFEQSPLTNRALPIKLLEYGLSRKHVLSSPLEELRRQSFPNVHLVERNMGLWAEALKALIYKPWNNSWNSIYDSFDWNLIVKKKLSRIIGVEGNDISDINSMKKDRIFKSCSFHKEDCRTVLKHSFLDHTEKTGAGFNKALL